MVTTIISPSEGRSPRFCTYDISGGGGKSLLCIVHQCLNPGGYVELPEVFICPLSEQYRLGRCSGRVARAKMDNERKQQCPYETAALNNQSHGECRRNARASEDG